MNIPENPPRKEEEVEAFEGSPVDIEAAQEKALDRDKQEKMFAHIDTEARVEQDLREIGSVRQATLDTLEKYKDTRSVDEKQIPPEEVSLPDKNHPGFKKYLKKITMALGMTGLMFGAASKASGETTPGDTLDFSKARPVTEKPAGYKEIKKDDKTYYYTTTQNKKLEMAKPSTEKGGEEYEKKMIELVKSGISPQELVDKKYISPDKAPEYEKYTKKQDVVYMESGKEKTVDPFAAFASSGEILFSPNKHAAAEMFYRVRDSKDIKDGGMLNTAQEDVLIRWKNDNGFTGEYTIVAKDQMHKILAGTRYFQSDSEIQKLKANSMNMSKTYNLTSSDIANATTKN